MTNEDTPATEDTQVLDMTGDQTPEVQSHRKRTKLIAIIAALALVLAGGITGGVLYANHVRETQRQESLASCERQLKQFKTALTGLDKAKADVAETVKVTEAQVADKATVAALAEAVNVTAPKTVACPADADRQTLDANGAALTKHVKTVNATAKEVADTATAVTESRAAKEVADAQRKLADTVAAHEKTLKGSAGKVADNKVRQQLRDALDAAIKSKASKDVKALGDNVSNVNAKAKAVTDAVAAKKKADEEAAARAAAAAAAAAKKSTSSYSYSGSGSGSGYSTGGSGSKSTYTPTATTQNNNTGGGNGLEGLDHLFHKKQKWTKDNPADWNDCTTWAAGC